MKARGGLRFKSLGEAQSKPFEQKQWMKNCLEETKNRFLGAEGVVNRNSGKVPPNHRVGVYCKIFASESVTRDSSRWYIPQLLKFREIKHHFSETER